MPAALPFFWRADLAVVAAAVLLAACGASPAPDPTFDALPGGTKLEPSSAAESDLLTRLDELPSSQPTTIAESTVVAEPPYFSASGRTCRRLTISGGDTRFGVRKLACKDERPTEQGDDEVGKWFFVPDVFAPLATDVGPVLAPRAAPPTDAAATTGLPSPPPTTAPTPGGGS